MLDILLLSSSSHAFNFAYIVWQNENYEFSFKWKLIHNIVNTCRFLSLHNLLINLQNTFDFVRLLHFIMFLCFIYLLLQIFYIIFLVIPGNRTYLLSQKRDSKSFDSGALYRQDYDDDDSCNGAVSISNDNKKILLPTPPIRSATVQQSTNQSEDENVGGDKMKPSPNRNGDERCNENDEEKAQKQSTEVS